MPPYRALGLVLIGLGAGVALNPLLGPIAIDSVTYSVPKDD